jgi:hypothetical protein
MAARASGTAAAAVSKRVVPHWVLPAELVTIKTCYGSAGQVSGGFSGNGIHIVLQGIADGFEGGLNFVRPIDQLDHLPTDLASINGEHWVELKCLAFWFGVTPSIVPGCRLLDGGSLD